MRNLVGALLLLAGVIYPLAAVFWLNQWIGRRRRLVPRQVGLVLAFNGVFPMTLIGLAVGLLSARLWASFAFRLGLGLAGGVGLGLLIAVWWQMAADSRKDNGDGRGTAGTDL